MLLPKLNLPAYHAACEGVVRYDATGHGALRMLGRDRADLLHRLSTNDVRSLTAGMGTRTVLTNHNARIIDLLTVYALPEHLLVVTSPGQGARSVNCWRATFSSTTRSGRRDHGRYGPMATVWTAGCRPAARTDRPARRRVAPASYPGGTDSGRRRVGRADIAARRSDRPWPSRSSRCKQTGSRLPHASRRCTTLDEATYQVLRIEAGYPAWQHELSLDYIPLETRLRDAVSFTKGCYIGQEIIARMDSRQRLAKQLMRFRLDAPVEAGVKLQLTAKSRGR